MKQCVLKPAVIILFLLFITGCSGDSSPTSVPTSDQATSDISTIKEISKLSVTIQAAPGGSIAYNELTTIFPPASLPNDAQIKASIVSVSNSKQDSSLIDMTGTYVISSETGDTALELLKSATLEFKVNPAGFDASSICIVYWNGFNWIEVSGEYNADRKVVVTSASSILPFGTRISYLTSARKGSPAPGVHNDKETNTEFVALKVVGIKSGGVAKSLPKFTSISSAHFIIKYSLPQDKERAEAVKGYLENGYLAIVKEMGFKEPGKCVIPGTTTGTTVTIDKWLVTFVELDDAYGRADAKTNNIEIQEWNEDEAPTGDGLGHTCLHEFFHLVQGKILVDKGNGLKDSLSWLDETSADAVAFYVIRGPGNLGETYTSIGDMEIGNFQMRLDDDDDVSNNDYQYMHYPFISYILSKFGHAKFKNFMVTFYSYPGKDITMKTIDKAATAAFNSPISGSSGIFWEFYRDYFISGLLFNMDKFLNIPYNFTILNIPGRVAGTPYEFSKSDEEEGVTLVDIRPGDSITKEFTMPQLSGQVAIIRFAGNSDSPMNLNVSFNLTPGQASAHIQMVAFKGSQQVGQPVDILNTTAEGDAPTFKNFGNTIDKVYVLMTNVAVSVSDNVKVNNNYKVVLGIW